MSNLVNIQFDNAVKREEYNKFYKRNKYKLELYNYIKKIFFFLVLL